MIKIMMTFKNLLWFFVIKSENLGDGSCFSITCLKKRLKNMFVTLFWFSNVNSEHNVTPFSISSIDDLDK